ncbi:MAG: phosphotransferase enzyme family protein [Candidatus Sericytochromatia bacterium]
MSASTPEAAALQVAARHGLPVERPVVLKDDCNLVMHLAPAPVVVRVATLTAEVRGPAIRAFLEREVEVVAHLGAQGAPAVAPADLLPAGPHEHEGHLMVFWRWVDHDPDRPVEAAVIGHALRDLHAALRDCPVSLPVFDPLAEAERILERLAAAETYAPADLAPLRQDAERLTGARERMLAAPAQTLHGDAHRGNLLRTPSGLLWTDFEETMHGPVEWDLACLVGSSRTWGPVSPEAEAALAAYGPHDPALLAALVELRVLLVAAWALEMGARNPRDRDRALARLDWWRAQTR